MADVRRLGMCGINQGRGKERLLAPHPAGSAAGQGRGARVTRSSLFPPTRIRHWELKVHTLTAIVVVAVAAAAAVTIPPGDCKYWCKDNNKVAYCCGRPEETYPPFTDKHPGKCPPVRSTCTDAYNVRQGRPQYCPHDGACQFTSKCCYDTCLEHHVCKTAEY